MRLSLTCSLARTFEVFDYYMLEGAHGLRALMSVMHLRSLVNFRRLIEAQDLRLIYDVFLAFNEAFKKLTRGA